MLSKVLVLRLSSIGDIILTSPFLRVFKGRFPETQLHYVVRKEYAELLRWNPHIDDLITVDVSHGRRALETLNLALSGERYDAVFDLHNHLRTRIIRNGISRHIHSINKRALRRLLLVGAHINTYGDVVPVPDRYIETGARYGLVPDTRGPELFYPDEVRDAAAALLVASGWSEPAPLIGICPGSQHFTKRWPLERYSELTRVLLDRGHTVAVFGSADDAALGDALSKLDAARVIDLCGRASLLETAAMMRCCSAIVANDSGLMHLATAVNRPVVAIFGSTVKEFGFFPYNSPAAVLEVADLPCRPCTFNGRSACPKDHFRCMRDISVESVVVGVVGSVRGG